MRNLKQALQNGYKLTKIYSKGSKRIRVDVTPRFYQNGMKAILSFWLTDKYIKKTYPSFYERN